MSQELNLALGTTSLTITASVYLLGVAKATGIACGEIGVTGVYAGDFTATPNVAGTYEVAFFNGAATVACGAGRIVWDGSAEVTQTGDVYALVGAAGAGLTALGDTRIANLDATVSSRTKPTDTQAAVTLVTTTTNLTNLPAVTTDWLTAAGVKADAVTKIQAGLSTYAGGAVASVTGAVGSVTGSVGSVASYGTLAADVATAVWAAGTRTLTSFGTVVADVAAAVWGAVARTITGTVTLDATQGSYAPAKAGDAMTLTGAYDAAKTAATQASVNAIPTTPLLAGSYTAPDNAGIGMAASAAVSAATDAAATRATTDGLVQTAGKLWVLDASGNPLPTTSSVMQADVKKVNGTTVTGLGTTPSPWGP